MYYVRHTGLINNFNLKGAIPRTHAAYGQGSGMIVERLRCNGTERRLRDCAIRDDADGLCRHYEDAGVQCCSCECKYIVNYTMTVCKGISHAGSTV